jgi:hypothetical protein
MESGQLRHRSRLDEIQAATAMGMQLQSLEVVTTKRGTCFATIARENPDAPSYLLGHGDA